jgi:hypothetical protein
VRCFDTPGDVTDTHLFLALDQETNSVFELAGDPGCEQ